MEKNKVIKTPVNGVIELLAQKWTICIINEIANHQKIGYMKLHKELEIPDVTLTILIRKLVEEQIIRKEPDLKDAHKINYILTEKGLKIRKCIIPLLEYSLNDSKCTKIINCN